MDNALLKKARLARSKSSDIDLNALEKAAQVIFTSPHKRFCERLSEIKTGDWAASTLTVKAIAIAKVLSEPVQPALYLSYSNAGAAAPFFICVDQALALNITQESLRATAPAKSKTAETALSRLDALLFSPIADVIARSFRPVFQTRLDDEDTFKLSKIDLSPESVGLSLKGKEGDEGVIAIQFALKQTFKDQDEQGGDKTSKNQAAGPSSGMASAAFHYTLYLPQSLYADLIALSVQLEKHAPDVDAQDSEAWAQHVRNCISESRVDIRAIAETCKMTIAECTRLSINQIIPLPGISLESINVEVDFSDMDQRTFQEPMPQTQTIAQGSLGIYKNNRAIKLSSSLEPEFTLNIESILKTI